MPEPTVAARQWGPTTFAAYLDLGLRYPVFVGVEESRQAAVEWGRTVLADVDGTLENRCGTSVSRGVSGDLNGQTMRELGLLNSDGPRSVTTPAHLPLMQAGASS